MEETMPNGEVVHTSEYMPAGEASVYLGISKTTMWKMLRTGVLPYIPSRLDSRIKMVKRADVEELKRENIKRFPKTDPQAA